MMKFLTAKIAKDRREVCKGKSNFLGPIADVLCDCSG
jgi:hypothetical protein